MKIIKEIRENGTLRVATLNEKPTRTQQQFADHCDINNIMKRYKLNGQFDHLSKKQGQFLDLTNVPDYQKAMDIVINANHLFTSLPAAIRNKFENDPAQMIAFLDNPANNEEAIKLGFKTAPVKDLDPVIAKSASAAKGKKPDPVPTAKTTTSGSED